MLSIGNTAKRPYKTAHCRGREIAIVAWFGYHSSHVAHVILVFYLITERFKKYLLNLRVKRVNKFEVMSHKLWLTQSEKSRSKRSTLISFPPNRKTLSLCSIKPPWSCFWLESIVWNQSSPSKMWHSFGFFFDAHKIARWPKSIEAQRPFSNLNGKSSSRS